MGRIIEPIMVPTMVTLKVPIISMNYDHGSSTIFKLHVVVIIQLQLKVLYTLAMHLSLEDDKHVLGSSSNDGDVLRYADNCA
jgi:hypothetical protein